MHRIDPRIVIIQIVLSVIFATPEGGFAAGRMVCVPCRIVCLTE